MTPAIPVCAAVVFRKGKVLVTSRPAGKPWAGYWEFPGGKVEPGETHAACLLRELDEELGLHVKVGELLLQIVHAYPEKSVELFFYRCDVDHAAKPVMHEGQDHRWLAPEDLDDVPVLPADAPLVALLSAHHTDLRPKS